MNRFSTLHPFTSAVYFASVLLIAMFTASPALHLIALVGGILFLVQTQKHIRGFRTFGFYLLFFFVIALTNPLFSHNGSTPLFFLNGNPVTLEAILYGADMGVVLVAVVIWFRCFNRIMSEDKLLFLFGRLSPKIALLISSALRFIPLLKTQGAKIRQSQKAMGLYASDTWTNQLKGTVRVYSALITWALENAIDTGASMKARGYGLKGRRHYSLYTFRRSDALLLMLIVIFDGIILGVTATGKLRFSFYPSVSAAPINPYTLAAVAAYFGLSLLPFILEVKEGLQWKYYRSRI